MKVGDRVITIRSNPWVDKGVSGKILLLTDQPYNEVVVLNEMMGIFWVHQNDCELVTFKTYLCLLNKDQPLKNLIKGITQTLLGK